MALGVLDREAGRVPQWTGCGWRCNWPEGPFCTSWATAWAGVALVEPHWIVGLAGDFFGADEVAKAGNGNVEFVAVGKFAGRKLG